jgi:glyoxylase-like metal-dependent hydrolase (beta-lactamase superfamily II)
MISSMASFHVLSAGYGGERVASTVSLVISGDSLVVIDPGMVSSRSVILDPVERLGYQPEDITDVVISHHHPDHTINIALFPNARVHDHWAIYQGDSWVSRPAEGFVVAPEVTLWETPGHTTQDITTIIQAGEETVAFTHLWWYQTAPYDDPLGTDQDALHVGRERVLEVATLIVPGHGEPFVPDSSTSR